VGEYTLFLSRPLELREKAEGVDAQDDDSSNKTSTTFSVTWVLVVEI
jgi:hypothetical protein